MAKTRRDTVALTLELKSGLFVSRVTPSARVADARFISLEERIIDTITTVTPITIT